MPEIKRSQTYFSMDYFEARDRFRNIVERVGGRLQILPLNSRGPRGESLSIDIASFGAEQPRRVLLHSSGLHGVEGFAGSAVQLGFLERLPQLPSDASLIVVHVLNPYGMAWLRRVNSNNVDLNRNSLENAPFSGAPDAYANCDAFLNPPSPPSNDLFILRALWLILSYGMNTLKQAIAGGQYEFPRGLFFGGKWPQPELESYRSFLMNRLSTIERLLVIDVHTGLGTYAEDTLLVDPQHHDKMKIRFGHRVAPLHPERGPAYHVRGDLQVLILGVFRHAKVWFVGQEFGTYSPIRVFRALREENRWHHFGDGTLDHPTKRTLKQMFCPDDETWRLAVLSKGSDLVTHACRLIFD